MLAQQTNKDLLASARASAKVLLAEFKAGFEAINAQLQMAFSEQPELPPIEIPAPEIDENRARQASLISSQSSWAEGTRALKSRKAYGEAK